MKIVWLNSRKMTSLKDAHHYLQRKLHLPAYYGGNLDALWDILSTISEPVQINLLFQDQLAKNLGSYSDDLVQVFNDAAKANDHLLFRIVKCS
jgi:ribonuclease inhibitor